MKKKKDCRIPFGKNGGLISVKDNGEPFAKIIVKMVLPGNSAPMKSPAAKPGAGVKTASEGWPISDYIYASPLVCGIPMIPYLRKDTMGLEATRAIMVKMSRNYIIFWMPLQRIPT